VRLLDGPLLAQGSESLHDHHRRLGPRPAGSPAVLAALERSGLVGRGGASFPTAVKWRSVASGKGPAVVIANGAEGEPLSRKDEALMATRPHLVVDGALIAAETVAADRVYLYVGERHTAGWAAMSRAAAERHPLERSRLRLVAAPATYTSGEETAAVHFVNEGVATPTAIPPRPFESGVEGRPTLVNNVETLANVALVARYGVAGTVLLTVGGAVALPGVVEVPIGATVEEALERAGGLTGPARAVLLGGYFGGWIDAGEAGTLRLDPGAMKAAGGSLGCGVVSVLAADARPLEATARIIGHLAEESAAQCGPCFFGLKSLAATTTRVAFGNGEVGDVDRLKRWTAMVKGRGACRHPDGAAAFMESALRVFEPEFAAAGGGR
jgi:NADH:ubiquinone oxidoreductase subunit F (NADH-binding)